MHDLFSQRFQLYNGLPICTYSCFTKRTEINDDTGHSGRKKSNMKFMQKWLYFARSAEFKAEDAVHSLQ